MICKLATSAENLVTSTQFLVALATSESQFQALHYEHQETETTELVNDVCSVSCAREYMWLNISFILIQSNLTYSSNAIALNLENQPIKTGEYCNISLPFFFFFK